MVLRRRGGFRHKAEAFRNPGTDPEEFIWGCTCDVGGRLDDQGQPYASKKDAQRAGNAHAKQANQDARAKDGARRAGRRG